MQRKRIITKLTNIIRLITLFMRRKFFMSFLLLAMGMLMGMTVQAQQKMRYGAWRVEQHVMQQHKNVIGRMNPPRSLPVGEGMDRSRFSSISGIITPQPNKQGIENYKWHSSSRETAPLTFGRGRMWLHLSSLVPKSTSFQQRFMD